MWKRKDGRSNANCVQGGNDNARTLDLPQFLGLYRTFHLHSRSWLVAGYLKALERGNSVPRPKGFCEADKLNFSAVLLQNQNCRDLRAVDTLIF